MITIMLKIKDVEIILTLEELKALKKELDDFFRDKPTYQLIEPITFKYTGTPMPPLCDNWSIHIYDELMTHTYKTTC